MSTWGATGFNDVLVRAAKTFITTAVGVLGANVVGWVNLDALQAAGLAGLSAAGTVLLNYVLTWASS